MADPIAILTLAFAGVSAVAAGIGAYAAIASFRLQKFSPGPALNAVLHTSSEVPGFFELGITLENTAASMWDVRELVLGSPYLRGMRLDANDLFIRNMGGILSGEIAAEKASRGRVAIGLSLGSGAAAEACRLSFSVFLRADPSHPILKIRPELVLVSYDVRPRTLRIPIPRRVPA